MECSFAGQIKPGQVLFGRYLVDSQLGEGGMGTVWLVRHLGLGVSRALKLIVSVVEKMLGEGGMGAVWLVRYLGLGVPRALKLIIPGIAFDPQARARFKHEAQVMAWLSHPNAVIVHNARMSKDAAFIEMEYIRGQSLNKLMRPGMPMPLNWVARILEQLCDVLLYAHDRGIVHQDLKPSNLMLLDGRPPGQEWLKVLDFGIAQILGATDHEVDVRTRPGRFLGTAAYSSPEQLVGELADARSDLYAVGVMLYEFLTGYRPFTGTLASILNDHMFTPPPFSEVNPNAQVPPEVEQVVLRCLAKNPDERYQSARELWEAFKAALEPQLQRTVLDEDVQFTVYRPKIVRPAHWYSMLAFAHLAERRPSASKDEPAPIEQVKQQADLILGEQAEEYRRTTTDSQQAIPQGVEITFLPDIPGIEFNPERRVFRWLEDVHREEFRLQASPELDGHTARGRLSVYLGMILLAEVDLAIRVDRNHTQPPHSDPAQESHARPYRKIFASYSHKDVEIVRQFEHLVQALGDRYLRDVVDLRRREVGRTSPPVDR